MPTTVAERKRTKGWRKPEGSVIVDRTSRWGNWWRVVPGKCYGTAGWYVLDHPGPPTPNNATWFASKQVALVCAVDRYRSDIERCDPRSRWIRQHVHKLAGKTLLCWPHDPCHAHVLAALADSRELEQ